MLALVKNQLVMGSLVDGQFSNQVTDQNGLTINIKRPPLFITKDGAALQAQDVVSGSVDVKVNQYKNVHVKYGDLETVQSVNDLLNSNVMASAASTLSHTLDLFLHDQLLKFNSWVGTAGETIKTPQQFNKVHTRLMNNSAPNANLNAVIGFEDAELIRGNLVGTDIGGINRSALERVRVPMLSEINVFGTQNIKTIVNGTRTNGTIDGAAQEVNYADVSETTNISQTLAVAGLGAAATVSKGEVFTIAGVNAVNVRNGQVLPYLQQFTVLQDAVADGTGDATLTISPAIIVLGSSDTNTAFATVDSSPANAAAVTFRGTASQPYQVRAAFNKQGIALVSARLQTPFSDTSEFVSDPETGIGIRYWRGSSITTGDHIHRWDMIYGAEVTDFRFGSRVDGAV
jgi:hypothetical protein